MFRKIFYSTLVLFAAAVIGTILTMDAFFLVSRMRGDAAMEESAKVKESDIQKKVNALKKTSSLRR